ncbi:MAG: HEAT repeat domain-containing protein [Planctomycetota bacterium]
MTGIAVATVIVLGLIFALGDLKTGGEESRFQETPAAVSKLTPQELRRLANDPKSKNRAEIIIQLGRDPGDLNKTVPFLSKLSIQTRDEMARLASEVALSELGTPAGDALRSLMESDDFDDNKAACSAMKWIGKEGSMQYLPQIQDFLLNKTSGYKRIALFALQGMGRDAAIESMDGLIVCLKDEDFNAQCSACRVLESLGPDAMDAEDALFELLENGNVSARGWAAICLGSIGPTSSDRDVVTILHDRLKKAVLAVDYQRLMIALAHLGREAEIAIPEIRQVLETHNDQIVQAHAAFALWKVSGETEETLTALKTLFRAPQIAPTAVPLAGRMGKGGVALIDDIIEMLKSNDPANREAATIALGTMGKYAEKSLPALREAQSDKDPIVASSAKLSIRAIEDDLTSKKGKRAKD